MRDEAPHPPNGGDQLFLAFQMIRLTPFDSSNERIGISRHELDEVRLAVRACFLIKVAEVGLDRSLSNAKCASNVGNASHFDNGEQDAQLARRELVCLRNNLG